MPSLPLPLHCYDDSGVIKPPRWLYLLLLMNALDWLVLIFALASMGQTSDLLAVFYPDQHLLWLKLAATIPFILTALLLGNRQRLWKAGYRRWVVLILPLCFSGVVLVATMLVQQLIHLHWRFELILALQIAGLALLTTFLLRSQHIRLLIKDWQQPDMSDTTA
ncbi:DUF2919 family protein [Salinimonas lutimaris]|uniref:DUF2919 family protein n=1 Tax=Salinimonas lutimaris TaxID=914153 RepID=UPI0010C00E27|nr:DUF2919 family protein [Salinimonas lutimaris]